MSRNVEGIQPPAKGQVVPLVDPKRHTAWAEKAAQHVGGGHLWIPIRLVDRVGPFTGVVLWQDQLLGGEVNEGGVREPPVEQSRLVLALAAGTEEASW